MLISPAGVQRCDCVCLASACLTPILELHQMSLQLPGEVAYAGDICCSNTVDRLCSLQSNGSG